MSDAAFPDRAALAVAQAAALRRLVAEVVANPFQQRRLARFAAAIAGQDPADLLATFRETVPLTTKAELVADQEQHPPYGTNLTYPLARYTRFCQTSATTGTPLRWLDTAASWDWMLGNWLQVFQAAGVRPGDRLFFAFSFGPFLGFWTAFDAATRMGCLAIPGGGMSSGARARAILDNQVVALCCTPTYALHLGEAARQEEIDLAAGRVRAVIVGGEAGAGIPATRARIEQLWPGARLWDHHGMTEVGPVSFECPARPGVIHVIETSFIPEVIDPTTGRPAAPGRSGELVLTNLGRWGSPLFRYRTGDLVQPAPAPCPCGRHDLALEGGILSRADDMVVVRGVNLYPTAVEAVVRRFPAVVEYQVEIRTAGALAEVTLRLEPAPDHPDPTSLAAEVESALRATFLLRVPVSPAPPGTLPRFELKASRWQRVNE